MPGWLRIKWAWVLEWVLNVMHPGMAATAR